MFIPKKKLDTKEDPHNNQDQSWDFDPDLGPSFGKKLVDSKKNGAKKPRNKSCSKGKETVILENVHPKKTRHNKGPTEQSYYWGTGLFMDYHLENLFGCNVLTRL